MTLPRHYQRRLQRFDPLLRMRWSAAREVWVLERRYRRAAWSLAPGTLSEDTYTQLRDGYMELGTYDARALPPVDRLTQYLGKMDTWNMGLKPEHLADAIEQRDELRTDQRERSVTRHFRDKASDTYDDIAAMTGARSYPKHTGFR